MATLTQNDTKTCAVIVGGIAKHTILFITPLAPSLPLTGFRSHDRAVKKKEWKLKNLKNVVDIRKKEFKQNLTMLRCAIVPTESRVGYDSR